MNPNHYTYRVTWSPEDNEHLGFCVEFPSLSWLAETPEQALAGIRQVVADVVADLQANGETIPPALADGHYSGEFRLPHPARTAPDTGLGSSGARGKPKPAGQSEIGGVNYAKPGMLDVMDEDLPAK